MFSIETECATSMERYEFKVKFHDQDKSIKFFLSTKEVEYLTLASLFDKIYTRIASLRGKELSLKYVDNGGDWVDLPANDMDSFIDMVGNGKAVKQSRKS